MAGPVIERLIQILARLPGLGPRSARRIVLALIKKRTVLLEPLVQTLADVAEAVRVCSVCGNFDTEDPCALCTDPHRDPSILCVVQEVADLWALERSGVFRGRYHVLGGVLSALDGIGPEDLRLDALVARARVPMVREVILALGATVDGQTTAYAIAERLKDSDVLVSGLAHGVPVGGELDYLDDGTILTALRARRPLC
ncbi:MAG: recombination protein RecR [Rhodospirillaceae bacterium]|nr:MAG: recombination protein RecR [Rhodospirillaceae bacterium]